MARAFLPGNAGPNDVCCPHPWCRKYFPNTDKLGRHYERAHFTVDQLAGKYALPELRAIAAHEPQAGMAAVELEQLVRRARAALARIDRPGRR